MDELSAGSNALPGRYWHADRVDWNGLVSDAAEGPQVGGHDVARSALAMLLGDAFWTAATHRTIQVGLAGEPVRSMLRMVRPAAAVAECRRVLREGDPGERVNALILLTDLADASHLDLVSDLLSDDDPQIRTGAAVLLRNIVFDHDVERRDVERLLDTMQRHPDREVRATADDIREWLG